jgi:hemerythrin-like domain-containing protein
MTPTPTCTRGDFARLLAEHLRLIELVNDLELRLHALSGGQTEGTIQALQQAAGSLVDVLRTHLFRQDQVVLPLVESLCRRSEPE